jgi:hypothetical protein
VYKLYNRGRERKSGVERRKGRKGREKTEKGDGNRGERREEEESGEVAERSGGEKRMQKYLIF